MNQKSNLWVLLLLILLLVAAVALLLHALFKPLPAAPQKAGAHRRAGSGRARRLAGRDCAAGK